MALLKEISELVSTWKRAGESYIRYAQAAMEAHNAAKEHWEAGVVASAAAIRAWNENAEYWKQLREREARKAALKQVLAELPKEEK